MDYYPIIVRSRTDRIINANAGPNFTKPKLLHEITVAENADSLIKDQMENQDNQNSWFPFTYFAV